MAYFTVIGIAAPTASAGPQTGNPDLTQGGQIPAGKRHDWTLGATGARGWMFCEKLVTSDARQIAITEVAEGSPAEGVLAVGDVLLGVDGKPFTYDPRIELGKALTEAESRAGRGRLALIRWRAGKSKKVTLKLTVLGSYSATAPYDCPKSERIYERGCEALAKRMAEPSYKANPITRSLNALALLASGERKYAELICKEALLASEYSAEGFQTWYYGYVIMLLSEYLMATGDDSVLPGLERLTLEAAAGQSGVGSWGHRFTQSSGRLAGYGMMNSPGLTLTTALVLARTAGVKDPVLDLAIERSSRLLRFYVGKGAIPYGDHRPWIQTHEDNGKCGMAAVLFNLLGEKQAAEYYSRMSIASHGPERDTGHTGNFFNILWSLPGVAQSGPHATGAWMKEFGAWYFDLAREWDGTFRHQGAPERKGDSYSGWDSSGAYLLAYAMPLKKIYLTGKRAGVAPKLNAKSANALILDGRGWSNMDRTSSYDKLDSKKLMNRLSSWSPVVRERAAMALGRKKTDLTESLNLLLKSKHLPTRYGACQALKMQGKRGAGAVPALLTAFRSDDLWLRILAAEALAGIGAPAKGAASQMLMRLAQSDPGTDPRNMEQRYLCFALFEKRGGLLGRSLDGVDRKLLMQAVRAGLLNEDGRARGSLGSVYQNLTYEELEPLLPAIYKAILEPSPSGIMFADGIRMSGLELFTTHRISEAIELLTDYSRNQKQHGSEKRIVKVMDLLKTYGTHGKRVISKLESVADYFEHEEKDFPRRLSLDKAKVVREAIAAIEASNTSPDLIYMYQ